MIFRILPGACIGVASTILTDSLAAAIAVSALLITGIALLAAEVSR